MGFLSRLFGSTAPTPTVAPSPSRDLPVASFHISGKQLSAESAAQIDRFDGDADRMLSAALDQMRQCDFVAARQILAAVYEAVPDTVPQIAGKVGFLLGSTQVQLFRAELLNKQRRLADGQTITNEEFNAFLSAFAQEATPPLVRATRLLKKGSEMYAETCRSLGDALMLIGMNMQNDQELLRDALNGFWRLVQEASQTSTSGSPLVES